MTGNIEYPRRERAPMRSWTQAQRGVLKPVRGEGDTKACLSFQRGFRPDTSCGVEILTIPSQTFLSELQPCARGLVTMPEYIGHVVVVAAAVDAKAVAVARARAVVREGGSAWGGLHGGGVCCLAVAVGRSSPLQVVAADVGSDAMVGKQGRGGKHEFIGISVGVTAEMDGVGATMEGVAVDREGMAVGNAGINAETTNDKGVTEAATVMIVGKAGAVMMVDKAKMVVVCGAEAMAATGDTKGVGAGRAEMGGCRCSGGHGRGGWGMWDEGKGDWRRGMSGRCGGDGGNIVGGGGEGVCMWVCETAGGDMTYPVKNWFQPVILQFWLGLV
ncbi:hypothetical protein F5148DRAFT_1152822 [Russula earlei]|uniref:Uncharacterized protein n=1 Tax=Russula earlei TaxID=71964 RepID=A0ACC0TV40_9AGAM|nr:hypothetical protein F5148DRAFT_1152822 [Russula earlei]